MKPSLAKKIIHQITADYDKISDHFDLTRKFNWPEIDKLVTKYVQPEMKILDLGCGNGRLLEILPDDINYIGLDISLANIKIAQKKFPEYQFTTGSILKIPCSDQIFDIVFAIASLHHIPSEKYRLAAMSEILRVLKPNGLLIMSNWNLFQPKYLPYLNKNFKIDPKLDQNDSLIPWKNSKREIITQRYYHAFDLKELENLAINSNFVIIQNIKIKNNLISVFRKKGNLD